MDIISRLEKIPVHGFHYRLLMITGLGWMFDAMDTGIIAFVLPALIKDWGLTPAQVGYIGSIGLVGMALGAVLSGTLADRIGRKKVFAGTLVIYSLATGLCGLSWDWTSLVFFRFLVGFGLGGQLPVAVTLVSEYAPPESRGRFIVLLESFWGLGWLAASLISYLLIPKVGWKMAFLVGTIPALYVFYIWKAVPESVRYLLNKNKVEEAHQIVCQMERSAGITPGEKIEVKENVVAPKNAFVELWTAEFFRRTLVLWLLWFGIVYSYYGIFTWLPSLMVKQGYDIFKTFEYVLIMTIAQLPGYFTAAYLVDKIGRKNTLAGFLAASAVCAYFFGQGGSVASVLWWGSMMSFFNLGAWGVVYTYTPELYPTRIRAFASGWAAAFGRIGGIVAPMVVAWVIVGENGFSKVFTMFTGVMLAVSFIVWAWGEETRQRSLDEISH